MAAFSVLGLMLVNTLRNQSRFRSDTDAQAETHQGLNAALDSLTRDIRLAGACLPTQPSFIPLAATSGTRTDAQGVVQQNDTVTIRTGAVTGATTCPQSTLTADAAGNSTVLSVADIRGFAVGAMAYLIGPNSQPAGEFITVTGVTTGSSCASSTPNCGTLTTTSSHVQYPAASSGLYGLEQRVYSIDATNYPTTAAPVPTLVRNLNGTGNQPIAVGIESLDVQYRLNSACPSTGCSGTCTNQGSPATSSLCDQPSANAVWLTVSQVVVTMSARSSTTLTTGGFFREQVTSSLQPRNLLVFRSS